MKDLSCNINMMNVSVWLFSDVVYFLRGEFVPGVIYSFTVT